MTPESYNTQYPWIMIEPTLEVGRTFYDRDNRVSITVVSATAAGATVTVQYGGGRRR